MSDDWPQTVGSTPQRSLYGRDRRLALPVCLQKDVGSGLRISGNCRRKNNPVPPQGNREIVEAFERPREEHCGRSIPHAFIAMISGSTTARAQRPRLPADAFSRSVAEGLCMRSIWKTGAMLWQLDVNQKFDVPKGWFGAGLLRRLCTKASCILILVQGKRKGAFDPATGNLLWKSSHHETSLLVSRTASFGIVFFTRKDSS